VIEDRWDKMQVDWKPAEVEARFLNEKEAWKKAVVVAKEQGMKAPNEPRKPVEPRYSDQHPATLFNGKINPLIPFAIRGAIWYQGESNAGNEANLYGLQLETMVRDWRARWNEGDFPFAWVQLPNFQKPQTAPVESGGWPLVREGMLRDLKLPNTGMAITIDIGEANNIHPHDKQDVGKRLAMWALAKVYGEKGPASGPLPAGHEIQGSTVVLSFKDAAGLSAKGGELKGFAIAGADKKWHAAEAKIDGERVVVSSPEVKQPVAVRYDWASNPDGNLYNGAGLPASPFRTDDWAQ
jgi:sialate O-acetylesterase